MNAITKKFWERRTGTAFEMRYFIDEAGDFNIPASSSDHRVAVASCLAFNDTAWNTLRTQFEDFRATLPPTAFEKREPRWHLLLVEQRNRFCDLLADVDGVLLTPVTLDLSHLSGRENDWLEPMLSKLDREPDLMKYETMQKHMRELSKQAHNLSAVQHLRIYAWAYCLHQALYHSIIFLGHGSESSSWYNVSISIDPVQPRAGSREEQVFSTLVLAWLSGWSRRHPFVTVEGVHEADHAFVKLYDTGTGIDVGKLVRPNLRWDKSKDSLGIQMADLTAGAIYQAASELKEGSESLKYYGSLMRSSPYGAARGPGLFSPLSIPPDGAKYDVLSKEMIRGTRRILP